MLIAKTRARVVYMLLFHKGAIAVKAIAAFMIAKPTLALIT